MRPMQKLRVSLLALLAGLASFSAHAQLQVSGAWARATVAQQKASGAFFQLKADADLRLVEARSPVAMMVEIHEMAMEGSVMRMRAIDGLNLKAGKTVEFKPGGLHVMLMGLSKPLNAGDKLPITLVYEDKAKQRREVQVQAEVRSHPKAQ